MRWAVLPLFGALLLAACNEGDEAEGKAAQPVPKTTPALLEFSAPEPVTPPPAPPAPVAYEIPKPPPAPPPPPLPPPPVLSAPAFDDPGPALRAAEIQAALARRQQTRAQIALAPLPEPDFAPEPKPEWRLKDRDYRRDKLGRDESTLPVDRHRMITADRYITAILENAINSQIPGRFIALVERNVYGADGRLALLPKGTRIICRYESLAKVGDTRLRTTCERALRPDGASILLTDAQAADQMARIGLIGDVDNRLWERYGGAFIISAVSALASLGTVTSDNRQVQGGALAVSQNLGQVTAQILEQTVDLAPVVTVAAGSRIQIIPATDIWLREPEQIRNHEGQP
ncbi:TrbI/VirB10 family protein [Desertibaculum subflavum]|uniref:TrbI/VirB10 family protein n=1 Tax=Desertibaculum subflavum TaxID=2268458 RepID=UPI0013C48CDA